MAALSGPLVVWVLAKYASALHMSVGFALQYPPNGFCVFLPSADLRNASFPIWQKATAKPRRKQLCL
jgi:hypothetical protein